MNPAFERYIGIDYSGAQTPKSSLKGMRVYEADRLAAAHEIEPPPSPRKYWTRELSQAENWSVHIWFPRLVLQAKAPCVSG
jgi:hypothetical protein